MPFLFKKVNVRIRLALLSDSLLHAGTSLLRSSCTAGLFSLSLYGLSASAAIAENLTVSPKSPASQMTLTIGIVPQQSPEKLAQVWNPILRFLSDKTGYNLRFATAKDISTFEQRLEKGEYDVAYMNPYHYTVFHKSPGYQVFAKEKDIRLKGIIVVRKDQKISSIQQLQDTTIAFPGPYSFAASILPQAEFDKQKIRIHAKYVASHDSVYLAVARGLFVAGGGVIKTFENIAPELRDQLTILWSTGEYTPHALAAHPRVAQEVVKHLQNAMLEMDDEAEGKKLLEGIGFKGISSAQDKDYDTIRRLNIPPKTTTTDN